MTRHDDDRAAGTPRRPSGQRSGYRVVGPPRRYEPEGAVTGGDFEPTHSRGTQRGGRGRRRRGRLIGYLLVAILALVLGLSVGYARAYFSDGEVGGEVTVVVEPGSSLKVIAARLEEAGVVKHARAFAIRAESDGYATRFMPGTYTLRVNQPYPELVALLLKGVKPPTVKVSIPEGSTLKQAGEIVAGEVKTIDEADYVHVARDDPPPLRLEGYERGSSLEGMLFPATYEVDPKATARSFVDDQLEAFEANFAKVDTKRATAAKLTEYDIVIIASMIDREAQVPAERPLVAAVVWNRLRKGMLLQFCSTVQYALGKTKPVLTFDDLEIDSPYNTYKHAGLPPTPISNPGLAAMRAAADPADVDYLYFVARDDGSGRHYFSTSYDQFLADSAKAEANGQ